MDTPNYFDPDVATVAGVGATLPDGQPSGVAAAFERGEVLGRYVVLEKLGQGGMGVVVSAYDATLDRRVALKLLHPHASENPENHGRMLREAQALAKLSHPGVVAVYDVGEVRERLFIAMEFIDGPNVRTWLREAPRTPAEILGVYRDAARGLQAAHDAGIVHRDLKPDNVLIGSDGHARVTDFGLAVDAITAATLTPASPSRSSTALEVGGRLTKAGVVMGTPAYMPIEQHRGEPTDHRSDQFSFCVALYESLYGVRPFSGANGAEYCKAIERGAIPGPPPSVSVPRRVHRALVRGLSAAPADRFPSMRALGQALTPPTRKSRTWIVGGLAGLAVGAGAVVMSDPPERPCSSFDARITTVYGEPVRQQIRAAFLATEQPYAERSHQLTASTLDDFAERWVTSATDACTASEQGEQSDRMLDLRMHCLDRSLLAFEAMTEVFSDVEASEVDRAPELATRLPDLDLCADLDALPHLTVLPETPEQSRDAEILLPVLERVAARILSNRTDAADALLAEHREALTASTYPLVQTLYKCWQGRLHFERTQTEEAKALLEEAHLLALEHGLDVEAARTAVVLGVVSSRLDAPDVSLQWFDAAGALARAAGSTRMQATVLASSADVLAALGRRDEAVDAARRAISLIEDDTTFPPRAYAELLLNYAAQLHARDGGDAGREILEKARAVADDDDVPTLAKINDQLLRRASLRGDFEEARELADTGIRLTKAAYGADSAHQAAALANSAIPLSALGRHDEALDRYDRALKLLEPLSGTKSHQAVLAVNLTSIELSRGRMKEARVWLERLDVLVKEAKLERREPGVTAHMLWATYLRRAGDLEGALAHARTALSDSEALFGASHFRTADALTVLAQVEADLGKLDVARTHAERARAYGTTVAVDRAQVAFVLARVLWSSNADRERAVALAREAHTDLARTPSHPIELADVTAWLTQNDPSFAEENRDATDG